MNLFEYTRNTFSSLLKTGNRVNKAIYQEIQNSNFDSWISDSDKCFELIKSEMEFDYAGLSSSNKERANHIILTWLMGVGFKDVFNINGNTYKESDGGFGDMEFDRLWLQTSMIHDYGYFCDETWSVKKMYKLKDLSRKYDLLQDSYNEPFSCLNNMSCNGFAPYFSYSYDEIKSYYKYRQDHSSDAEKRDHGIVGGCIAFDKYCTQAAKQKAIMPDGSQAKGTTTIPLLPSAVISQIQKIACIITASHNIFKSDGISTDKIYEEYSLDGISSGSEKRVTKSNPLLLLLSLVDTIECTKRFSKKSNSKQYIQQITILKNIDIKVQPGEIRLNFMPLMTYLKREKKSPEMEQTLEKHVGYISQIGTWTDFKASQTELCVVITL